MSDAEQARENYTRISAIQRDVSKLVAQSTRLCLTVANLVEKVGGLVDSLTTQAHNALLNEEVQANSSSSSSSSSSLSSDS